ncbi:SsgA family sporulation/cell division regulator [Kitasatospora sp. NPDC052868]|uniref:SsgA family sporulation/cell division regulator n=1 Tax=Kitasatospora sp. NPDC052868 TaxID=3364060 RepID=UPI0037C55947
MDGSSRVVTAQVRVELITAEGDGVAVQSSWVYDTRDPIAVRIDFQLTVGACQRWLFARALLAEGLTAPAGEGDVVFAPETDGVHVLMLLCGVDGAAVLRARTADLRRFLHGTYACLPQGAERCGDALDRWLPTVLGTA